MASDVPPEPAPPSKSRSVPEVPDGSGVGCGVLFVGMGVLTFAERVGWVSPQLNWFGPLVLVALGVGMIAGDLLGAFGRRRE
jgi:hypothetical protein